MQHGNNIACMQYSYFKKGNIMTILTDDLITAISEIQPAMVATVDKDGCPNVSPKGSFKALDAEHVVFADLYSPQTVTNLQENPLVSAIGLNSKTRKGWRIWGEVAEIITSGDLFEQATTEYAKKGKLKHLVKIKVNKGLVF